MVLAILVGAALIYQGRYTADQVRLLADPEARVRAPFGVRIGDEARPEVGWARPEALEAGLNPGDRISAIGGRPFDGGAVLAGAMRTARPGDRLSVERDDGASLSIALAGQEAGRRPVAEWGMRFIVHLAMPWLCLLLGAWVTALKPRDPVAWMLLAMLVSFSQVPADDVSGWGSALRVGGNLYQSFLVWTWPIWMMLFGLWFPERLAWERSHGWLAWILIGPLVAFAVAGTAEEVLRAESFAAADPFVRGLAPLATLARILQMAAIGVFFMMLGIKSGVTRSPDARRRLVLLHTGASISLTPAFIAAILGLVSGRAPIDALPQWLVPPVLFLMMLFPLTLAYVIVVHRAMGVSMVIRQGVRYAFARGGVMALRVVLSAGIILAITLLASRPSMRRVEIVTLLSAGIGMVFMVGMVGQWVIQWTDRRFFRDACDAEKILGELSEQVRTMMETGPLLETVAGRISASLHVPRVAVLLEQADGYRPALALGHGDLPSVRFEDGSITLQRLRQTKAPQRVWLDDPTSWASPERMPAGERASLERLDAQVLLPLGLSDRMPGFLCLGPRLSEAPYTGGDLRLLQSVATQTALALENSRLVSAVAEEVARRERLNREVEIAREVQERLFPQRLPPVPGLDYSGACRPALGVGGDYYDFLALDGGRLGIAIGDISGKGIGAALLMASLQASLRGQTLQAGGAIATVVDNVNQLVHGASPDNRYATFFYAQYEHSSRLLTYVNAGHCPPMVLRRSNGGQELLRLASGGTVIGLFPEATYQESTVALEAGDLVIAYTDGISEAMNADDEEWGEERLAAAAGACDGMSAAQVIEVLMRGADAFAAGAPQHDDMTIVVMRVS